jgi:hypothetical protein
MQLLIAPDTITANKLQFARYEFDLSELYARKLRKGIYEQKGTFLMLAFKGTIRPNSKKFIEGHAMATKTTNLGLETAKLTALHIEVSKQIETILIFVKVANP